MSVNGEKLTSVNAPFDYSPLISGVIATGLDHFLLGEEDWMRNTYVGVATVGGIYAGQVVTPMLPSVLSIPSNTLWNGKTLETRLSEITLGAGGAWAINTYLLKNGRYQDWMKKGAIVAVSNVAGVYINDYLTSKPMSYLG